MALGWKMPTTYNFPIHYSCRHVLSHISILPICIWAVPYAYRQPIYIWVAHMCMDYLYIYGLLIHVWAGPYLYEMAHIDIAGYPCFVNMH